MMNLKHKNLEVYKAASKLINECYSLTNNFPDTERFNITLQIRRAALSVKLNLTEGASRKSGNERKRYYEIARGSVIEIDAAFEAAVGIGYIKDEQTKQVESLLNQCFRMLSKMISM